MPPLNVAPTPPSVSVPPTPARPMRRSVTVWPLTTCVSDLMASEPVRLPRPATVSVPLETSTSWIAVRSVNTIATPATVVLMVRPRVLTRTLALALRLTASKPLKAAVPLATSA